MVAAGELGTVDEWMTLDIASKEDVVGLGLERGNQLTMLQLFSFQQTMEKRLTRIERQLRMLVKGKGRAAYEDGEGEVDEDSEDEEEGGGDYEM